MINIAICDNDRFIVAYAEDLLIDLGLSLNQKFEIVAFFSGEEFCDGLRNSDKVFDIVLMDIEMGDMNGVDVGKILRENSKYDQTFLIYISSYNNYYKDIINLNVHNFISKPFNIIDFNLKLSKVIEKAVKQQKLKQYPDYSFKKNGSDIYVPVKSIIYVESELRRIHIHLPECIYTFYGNLNTEEKKLPSDLFCRIHRSYLICFAHITQITAQSVIIAKKSLNISMKYREAVKNAYNHYRSNLV